MKIGKFLFILDILVLLFYIFAGFYLAAELVPIFKKFYNGLWIKKILSTFAFFTLLLPTVIGCSLFAAFTFSTHQPLHDSKSIKECFPSIYNQLQIIFMPFINYFYYSLKYNTNNSSIFNSSLLLYYGSGLIILLFLSIKKLRKKEDQDIIKYFIFPLLFLSGISFIILYYKIWNNGYFKNSIDILIWHSLLFYSSYTSYNDLLKLVEQPKQKKH